MWIVILGCFVLCLVRSLNIHPKKIGMLQKFKYRLASQSIPIVPIYSQNNQATSDMTYSEIPQFNSVQYYFNITMGGTENYYVQIITESSLFSISSENCSYCPIIFNTSQSPTYKDLNQPLFTYEYWDGTVAGYYGNNIVSIVGTPINVNYQTLFVNQFQGFSDFPDYISGIMGLSSYKGYENIFDIAAKQKQINSPLFGFNLNPVNQSSYLLYNFDEEFLEQNATWVETISPDRWEMQLIGFYIDGYDVSAHLQYFKQAIVNSGVTCLMLNQYMITYFYNKYFFRDNDNCKLLKDGTVNCDYCAPGQDNSSVIPNITLYFRGVKVEIPFYNYVQYHYHPDLNRYKCSICLQYTDVDRIYLGDPFFQSAVLVFNKETQSIGFINANKLSDVPGVIGVASIMFIVDAVLFLGVIKYIHYFCANRKNILY